MDEKMFVIRSSSSDREWIFSPCEEHDGYRVEIKSAEISASLEVYQSEAGESLADFFRHLASYRSPWQEPQVWSTWDPDLTISAICTVHGHVLLRVSFNADYLTWQEAEGWKASIGLETTLGELDTIAREAARFFQKTTRT